jgi:hypothetical protein
MIKCDFCRGSLGLNVHRIGACDTVLLTALRLISVALMTEQRGRYAVLSPGSVIPESLLRAKVESAKQLRNGIF